MITLFMKMTIPGMTRVASVNIFTTSPSLFMPTLSSRQPDILILIVTFTTTTTTTIDITMVTIIVISIFNIITIIIHIRITKHTLDS